MTKNHDRKWAFRRGPEKQLHDILWAIHDGKNPGRSKAEEYIGVFPLWWVVGAEQCAFLSYTYARVCEALALTEPERGVRL